MLSPIELILPRLEGVVTRPNGQYFARCPAHEDKSPSLSIKELNDGKVLVYCFAQCGTEAICDAMGVKMRDLFPDGGLTHEYRRTPRWNYKDLLSILSVESAVVEIASAMISRGEVLPPTEQARLEQATQRIRQIVGVARVA